MAGGRRPQAALLLLLLAVAATWPSACSKKAQSAADKLASWVVSKGGKLNGIQVRKPCPTCVRGVFATKDFNEDDTIISIPFTAVIRLKDMDHSPFPAEYARHLLDSMHNDPGFNKTWKTFWATQPGPDGVFTPEVYTDQHIEMLHCGELGALARAQRQVTEEIYLGTYRHIDYEPFSNTVPQDRVSLDTFKYIASLIGSRYFGFYRDGSTDKVASHLLPLVDTMNHADDPNAARSDDGDNVVVTALRPITKGEELTSAYQPGLMHRPDMSLYIYGFVQMTDTPLLSSIDLPDFDPKNPFVQTAMDDSDHDVGGKHATQREFNRLKARLAVAAHSASEADDVALLEGGTITDWRQRSLLQFRVLRKRALQQTLDRIEAALASGGAGGSAAAGSGQQVGGDSGDSEEEEDANEDPEVEFEAEGKGGDGDGEEEDDEVEQEAPKDEF